ncbi:carbohydrate ABC transporter permease [Italian clover phyllody phytoplasma]|uniref:carbohydrate ABC transporter permease n=1 Tax=Italian clover phyllody phytoplasma TaxID=1196420 RepID=UPI0002F220C9|nr:sugar ABC transporter permease [Italian clover phyllody phytoplasma]
MLEIAGHKKNKHWFYLAPTLIALTLFSFFPLIKNIIISFNGDYQKFSDSFSKTELLSFKNYDKVLRDVEFRCSLRNTLILVLLAVPISLTFALVIALALNSVYNHYLKDFFKTFFFLPLLANTVIMGMIFSSFFYHNNIPYINKPEGLFNNFLILFGMKPKNWINISAPYMNKMFVIIFYNIWHRLPFKIFVFVLALQDINKSYYDAAKIDGASKWRIFTKITLPLLAPALFYQFIIELLTIMKEYESVVGVFGKNADYRIQTIVGYIYSQINSPNYNSYSKGAAAAVILLFFSVLFTTISFVLQKKKKINYRK